MNSDQQVRYPEVLSVRIPATVSKTIHELAEADDRPVSAFARRLILRGLEEMAADDSPAPAGAA